MDPWVFMFSAGYRF
ncbi:hypothetical protein ACFGV3_005476 [Escherichia coli]